MAKFEVHEVFRLPRRGEIVIAGKITEGVVQAAMSALVWLDGQLFWNLPVQSIEYLDRVSAGESLVALICKENAKEDAELCSALCPTGSIIDVKKAEGAVISFEADGFAAG
jgi:hypothetical protein